MHLCRLFLVALVTLGALAALAADPPEKDKDKEEPPAPVKAKAKDKGETPAAPAKDLKAGPALAVGKNLPGPFHPFNANGPRKGNFHCLVSQHGLDPMVLLFVRDLEASEPLKDLLRRLDVVIAKNPNVRLAGAVVFLSDDLPDVVLNDDKRDELAQKLDDLANTELKLKNVVLAVDGKADLEKYDLEREEAAYTLVLFRKLKIVATEPIARDKLTAEKVDEILKLVADQFGAVRK